MASKVTVTYSALVDGNPVSNTFTFMTKSVEESSIQKSAMKKAKMNAVEKTHIYGDIDITEFDYTHEEVKDNQKFKNVSSGEDISTYQSTKDGQQAEDTSTIIPKNAEPNISVPNSGNSDAVYVDEVINSFKWHAAWDPRLYRLDEYFLINGEDGAGGAQSVRVPFGSQTAVTAFTDQANIAETGMIWAMANQGVIDKDSYIYSKYKGLQPPNSSSGEDETTNTFIGNNNNDPRAHRHITDKDITHDYKPFTKDGNNWAVQSLMNPYSVTKLAGGLDIENGGSNVINYMYDIRDQRRFYSSQDKSTNDVLSISNPSVSQLIKWSNADLWGRTPYSFQDFVYCKYFGLIPNNRLITLRRYAVPTYDNLQFPGMHAKIETTTENANGEKQTEQNLPSVSGKENRSNKVFSPVAYVVTWFGGDTGNTLSGLMNFMTGIKWGEVTSQIWNVEGEEGESKQAVIDRMLGDGAHQDLFHSAEMDSLNSVFRGGSMLSAKITSFGKLNMAMTKDIGLTQNAYDKLMGANVDPYDSTFKNRILGPINRIDTVKRREAGIKFSQTLNIKCAYKAKAIGGINPKAALLDVLGNCLEMVSPHAVFWGGGHRFMIKPQIYPFHDGGWRDSFMERIYDGKILGNDGAIATALSGIKKVGQTESGEFNFDILKGAGKGILGMLGGAISSISDIFGGVDLFDKAASALKDSAAPSNADQAAGKDAASSRINSLFNNLKNMWHNRVLEETMLPKISAGGNLLVGEPVGEWHLTVGNPLNPIMVIGNLICQDMKVQWDDELGPDDFPEGFTVEYTLEHAMARDSAAIQSMFNRGMGKYYTLPDYINLSSDRITYVDKYTKDAGTGDVGTIPYMKAGSALKDYGTGYKTFKVDPGHTPSNSGTYNTTLITKFIPLNTAASRTVIDRRTQGLQINSLPRIKSLAATRKQIGN